MKTMADDQDKAGKTDAGGSSTPAPSSSPNQEPGVFTPGSSGMNARPIPPSMPGYPEPQILSETIIETDKVLPPKLPVAPIPPVMAMPIPEPQPTALPPVTSMPKPAPESVPLPAFTSMPKPPQDGLPHPHVPQSPLPVSGPLPAFTSMPKPPQPGANFSPPSAFRTPQSMHTPEISDPEVAKSSEKMSSDIQRILKGVKLPERTDIKGSADKKIAVPNISDTSLQPAAPKELKEVPPGVATDTSPVVALHTLKDDIKNVVLEKKISIIRAASLEQDRQRGEITEEEVENRPRSHSYGMVFASGLFVFLGLAAIAGVYVVEMGRSGTTQAYGDSMVFSEQSLLLQIDGMSPQGLKSQLAAARQTGGAALGSISRLIPVKSAPSTDATQQQQTRLATTAEFLRALGTHAPDELVRALSDNFFFGIHTVDKNAPVLVIPVVSYDHAFAGMLQWEGDMNTDLAPVFSKAPDTQLGPDGTPSKRAFQDAVMRNYDVRALKDESGGIILYYSFPTPRVLIIAESPYSFNELLSRLQAQRQL